MGERVQEPDATTVHLLYIREAIDKSNEHLEKQNGRLRRAENTLAVHSWAIGLGGAGTLALIVWVLSKL